MLFLLTAIRQEKNKNMRNKYQGKCEICGKLVKPGEGHFERRKGHFVVKHAECVLELRAARSDMSYSASDDLDPWEYSI